MKTVPPLLDRQPLILQLLQVQGLLDNDKQNSLSETRDTIPVERLLVKKGLVSERDIARAYADYLELPLFDPPAGGHGVEASLRSLLPEKLCREQLIAPLAVRGNSLDVAFVTPNEMLIIDEVQLLTGLVVRPMIASYGVVEGLHDFLFGAGQEFSNEATDFEAEDDRGDMGEPLAEPDDEVLHLDQPLPPGRDGRIIRLVNQVLEQAVRNNASDIHLEPFEDGCKVRYRIDGVLHEIAPPPRGLFVPMISRFKILGKMDIAEKRVPQDGAIALKSGERRLDLRVSTVPTVYGEKMVMRLLDKTAVPLTLRELGFDERQMDDLMKAIQAPHGFMLVTGPTGSGKSTTLYACLKILNECDTNICTVEDPVEYKFKGMNQVQVKPQVGLTFASVLRAFLRQDPDVIMVGEIRDNETAQICLRAALTGHFVLSTIHTNDSLSAVSRLETMDIEPFLLASALRVVQAQRLIRRRCKECKEAYSCEPEIARQYGLEAGMPLYRPTGCPACRGTGYKGRMGIFEVVRITPRLADLIQNRASLPELRREASAQGVKLLAHSALDKARQGITSLEEALTTAVSDDEDVPNTHAGA
jgi:type IV pilus assembly protein PilB